MMSANGVHRAPEAQTDGLSGATLPGLPGPSTAGNAAAFESLWESHWEQSAATVFGLALSITGDVGAAEQVTQEAHRRTRLAAARVAAARVGQDARGVRAEILAIAHRAAVEHVRAVRVQDSYDDPRVRDVAGSGSWPPDPTDRAKASDVALALGRQFGQLAALVQQALHLTYFEGLTYHDAAARLGLSPRAVTALIREGLTDLAAPV